MESIESKLGYYPQCPHCKSDKGLEVNCCPHTVGANGTYEIVSCKGCKAILTLNCIPFNK